MEAGRRGATAGDVRPHILAIPVSIMGHMTPVVQICKILVAKAGCRATIVCLDRAVAALRSLLGPDNDDEDVKVLPIWDGLPPCEHGPDWDLFRKGLRASHEVLPRSFAEEHMESFRSDPQVVCVMSDVYLSWTQDVADQLGVPRLAVWTSSPAEYQVYFHAKDLVKAKKLPFEAPLGRGEHDIDNMLPGIPGRAPIYHRTYGVSPNEEKFTINGLPTMTRRDFPTFLQIEESSDVWFSFFIEHVKSGVQASMVLFNTFETLDGILLDVMRLQGINAHGIGPLFMLEGLVMNKKVLNTKNGNISSIEEQKGKGYIQCVHWLDGQNPRSVIYVAFGTLIVLSMAQVKEVAMGLLKSGQPFIWAYPEPLGEDASIKKEFIRNFSKECEGKGLILEWAPQRDILNHPSTGAFLTHCGWNSTMETICSGVPSLCMPFVSDQILHCKLMVEEWKVGLGLERSADEGLVLAKDISQLTEVLLVSEKGKELQKRAEELSEAAKISILMGGSSHTTLDAIVELLKLPPSLV